MITRAITLWPEWAYAVLFLGKDVENRPIRLPPGRYALHAGKHIGGKKGPEAERQGALSLIRLAVGAPLSEAAALALLPSIRPLCGCVVGVIDVERVYRGASDRVPPSRSLWAGYDAIDPFTISESGERPTIANPIKLRHVAAAPIPCRGQLGLWRLPPEIASAVNGWPLEPL